MQTDDHLTLRETHGNPEALLVKIKHIQKLAMYQANSEKPLSLRSILSIQPPFWYEEQSNQVFIRLSPLIPVRGRYLAVSYTWERSETAPAIIPQYCVVTPDNKHITLTQGLDHVIYRTMRISDQVDIQYICIDQLCVDQTDPQDVEMHLQCMHKVYDRCHYTLAPLSCCIDEPVKLRTLQEFLKLRSRRPPGPSLGCVLELFEYITQDRWFSRTWTYHER
jgi:hypothetical protein